ncbi:MAG: YggT family protein [Candidatus Komeilibacteria bacterium]|nr:YggT family protein [Candidatus Komeilibacteria bacterium]
MTKIASVLLAVINVIFGVIEILIGLRIILKLFGASTGAGFVQWVYETTQPLLTPFLGMFPSPRLEGGFVLEFSALFALIVYGLLAYLLSEIIRYIDNASRRD